MIFSLISKSGLSPNVKEEEYLYVSDIKKMKINEYDLDKDYIQCLGKTESRLTLDKNTGVLFVPEDAHKPSMSIGNIPVSVKKPYLRYRSHIWEDVSNVQLF